MSRSSSCASWLHVEYFWVLLASCWIVQQDCRHDVLVRFFTFLMSADCCCTHNAHPTPVAMNISISMDTRRGILNVLCSLSLPPSLDRSIDRLLPCSCFTVNSQCVLLGFSVAQGDKRQRPARPSYPQRPNMLGRSARVFFIFVFFKKKTEIYFWF